MRLQSALTDDNNGSNIMKKFQNFENVTQREDFPEQDAVGPHIALEGVDAVENALRRHPLDRQASLERRNIILRDAL